MLLDGAQAAVSSDQRATMGGNLLAVAGKGTLNAGGVGFGLAGDGAGIVALLLAAVCTLTVALLWRRAQRAVRQYAHMRKVAAAIPGPPTLPLVGNVLDVVGGGDDHIYDNLCHLVQRYGTAVRLWLGPELILALTDPRDMEFLCTSLELTEKSGFYKMLEPLLGRGISCLGGAEVRHHRKIVFPSLHLDILHDFLHIFSREARGFADRLGALADSGAVFDVAPLCVEYSLAAAMQTIMSTDVEVEGKDVRTAFGGWMLSAMETFMYRVWRPWFLSDTLFRLSSRYGEFIQTESALNNFTESIVRQKRQQLRARQQQDVIPTDDDDGAPKKRRRRAFLDNVLDNVDGAALTDREIRDEVKTLLCTGAETSASTLSFILLVLAMRQDVQDRLVQELDDVFGDDQERAVTMEELPHLQYLERVIKETLRVFPVLPFFTRHCPRDLLLPSGVTAPQGCHLAVFLPALHTSTDSWGPDARQFDPDRFLPECSVGRHPFCYIPFSAGSRNCVGQRYALMLLKVEVATLLRRFRFLPPPDQTKREVADVPIRVSLVIAAKGGVRVRVQRR